MQATPIPNGTDFIRKSLTHQQIIVGMIVDLNFLKFIFNQSKSKNQFFFFFFFRYSLINVLSFFECFHSIPDQFFVYSSVIGDDSVHVSD